MDSSVETRGKATTADDEAAIAKQVKRAGSSFYWAMRMMPAKRRAALFAIYAFCREVDDIADGDLPLAEKRAALGVWRSRIAALYEGRASGDTVLDRAILSAIADYDLKRADFEAVIRGMEMDADGPIQAPSFSELMDYCDCVASAVGRLCVRVFGTGEDEGIVLSDHLGKALQLTNIIRDVEEDAQLGRLYLPRELLKDAGIETVRPEDVVHHSALAAVKRALAGHAAERFERARAALDACTSGDLRPALIMMTVYERIYHRMEQNGFSASNSSALGSVFSKAEKLAIALRFALGAKGR